MKNLLSKEHVEYCCPIWSDVPDHYIHMSDRLQNKVSKAVGATSFSDWDSQKEGWKAYSIEKLIWKDPKMKGVY